MEFMTFKQVRFIGGEYSGSYEVIIPRFIVIRYSNSQNKEISELMNSYDTKDVSDMEIMLEKEVLENL